MPVPLPPLLLLELLELLLLLLPLELLELLELLLPPELLELLLLLLPLELLELLLLLLPLELLELLLPPPPFELLPPPPSEDPEHAETAPQTNRRATVILQLIFRGIDKGSTPMSRAAELYPDLAFYTA